MKILVTGGCGFIGSALVKHLLANNYEVLNIDKLTYASNADALKEYEDNDKYSFLKVDIADKNAISTSIINFEPDFIMHLAAESHVDRSIASPYEFIETNIIGTYNLLEASLAYWENLTKTNKKVFRFLHVSTDEVYGSLGKKGKFSEITRYDPSSPYSSTKASSDHLCMAWNRTFDLPVLITNCSNNFGPFQNSEKLIPTIIKNLFDGNKIPIYGDGKNIRDWLYVQDHVEALVEVLKKGHPGETYNIGSNNEITNLEIVRSICKIFDEKMKMDNSSSYLDKIEFVKDRAGHDQRYALDVTKIKRDIGWQSNYSFEDSLSKTVDWYIGRYSNEK